MDDNADVGIRIENEQPAARWQGRLWHAAWLAIAVAYAVPIASNAYEELIRVNQQARAHLIEHHRLWETELDFRSKPHIWTRIASRLLNDHQLLARVALKYGPQAEAIELEYRRDLTIARAEVVLPALALWAGPLAALYALVWVVRRRRCAPPRKTVEPPSVSDPRYRPPA